MARTKGLVAGMALSAMLLGGVACGGSGGGDDAKPATNSEAPVTVAGAQNGSETASPQSQEAARMVQEAMAQLQGSLNAANGAPQALTKEQVETILRNQMNHLLNQAAKP